MLLAVPLGESVAESYTDEAFRLRGGASYQLTALTPGAVPCGARWEPGASVLDATVLHFGREDAVNVTLSLGFAQASGRGLKRVEEA